MKCIKFFILIGAMVCLLQPISSRGAEKIKLIPLEPLPGTDMTVPHRPLSKRPGYNKQGRIDAVKGNDIIINDILRFVNSSTQVYSSSNSLSSKNLLIPGKKVEYKMDANNVILKIRILRE